MIAVTTIPWLSLEMAISTHGEVRSLISYLHAPLHTYYLSSSPSGGGQDYNKGQLGLGHAKDIEKPQKIKQLEGKKIVKISCG